MIKNSVFMFPGQGSQFIGMGKKLAETYPSAMRIFDLADEIMGESLKEVCWEGQEDKLRQTRYTQPAIVTHSIATLVVLEDLGLSPSAVTGHSIGEYAALFASGAISMEDAIMLVMERGKLMQEAGDRWPGTMSAIIGLPYSEVEEICNSVDGIVEIANLNSPQQVVISGEMKAVSMANEIAREKLAKKVIPLSVSAAFHSPLMEEASKIFAKIIDKVEFKNARIPVIMNVTGKYETSGEQIKYLMKRQIRSQVRWLNIMNSMKNDNVRIFCEVGPGKVLSGLVKRFDRSARIYQVGDPSGI
ncbi:MAG: ACP S-malonyltransferase, partial [Candidatus Eremiobacteraeota bacterium]|nr:ACP S-malonyltransferase [Candidatus Eremiobacteraeota bacterium]